MLAFAAGGMMPDLPGVELVVSSLQLLPLVRRRSHPAGSVAVLVLGCLLQVVFLHTFLPSQLAVPIVVYTLAKYAKRWQSFAGLAAGITGAVLATLCFGTVGGIGPSRGWSSASSA